MTIRFYFPYMQRWVGELSKGGDALERLNAIVDWEMLLAELARKERKSAAGRGAGR
ncbi:MAG: hypothetical protein ACRETB_07350 [Steroidobacteraceae bacterium]